jgi:hypothetical protein
MRPPSLDPSAGEVDDRGGDRRFGVRVPPVQALMRTVGVVVDCVLGQDPAQVPWPEDQDPVQELTTQHVDPAAVLPRVGVREPSGVFPALFCEAPDVQGYTPNLYRTGHTVRNGKL